MIPRIGCGVELELELPSEPEGTRVERLRGRKIADGEADVVERDALHILELLHTDCHFVYSL